jgi:peptide deformylase
MTVQPIVLYDSKTGVLRQKSALVHDGLGSVKALINDLKDTLLRHGKAIGLAAPQIGVHKRVIVVCCGADNGKNPEPPIGIINPVIIEAGQEMPDFDGCLSFPGLYAETVRPHFMRLRGIDERGETFEWTLKGFDAVVVHHEVDHLNGVLFVDRVSSPDKIYTQKEEYEH